MSVTVEQFADRWMTWRHANFNELWEPKITTSEAVDQRREMAKEAKAAEKQEELNAICGRELNVNSYKDCQKYFYIDLGIPPYYNEGSITADDKALQRLARGTAKRPGLKQAKLVQDIRGLNKLHGTYLEIEFDSDSRMRCSYNPRGTKFGRLSSSKTIFGTGTNTQNLPPEFKRFLVADPGYILWEVDKRQAEWVVVAYLTGDANMLSIVRSGKDTHLHTAALMLSTSSGLPYEECWQILEYEAKLIGNSTDEENIRKLRSESPIARFHEVLPRTMSGRQRGKKSNHGLNYDEGPNKYALINELEPLEGKHDVELYHFIYPVIRLWYEIVKRQLQKDRTLTNCFGRKVRFMDAWGPDLWKAAYAMLPQSSVVDSLNIGLCKIYDDLELVSPRGANIDILAQVHDSILMQVPIERALSEQFKIDQQKIYNYISPQLSYNGRTFTIATDMKVGTNWGTYHKDYNPNGMREVKTTEELQDAIRSLDGQGTR